MTAMKTKGKPTDIDVYVGRQLRRARIDGGISQATLAACLDVTWQQVAKYESGTNRLSPAKLALASRYLGLPIDWFFPGEYQTPSSVNLTALQNKVSAFKEMMRQISAIALEASR